VNPANGEVLRKFATATDGDAEVLLADAHAAYRRGGRRRSPNG
jgi:acyl-CoA reductase-like NAD-dependent aldehyde dehydrogenase